MKNKTRLEAAMSASFRKDVASKFPDAFIYKIPDTFGVGGMRPFDCIIIVNGQTFAIEFKRGNIFTPTAYQKFHLDQAERNGATSWVVNEENRASKLKALAAIALGPGASR